MVRTPGFHCGGHGFDPQPETKILQAMYPEKKRKVMAIITIPGQILF